MNSHTLLERSSAITSIAIHRRELRPFGRLASGNVRIRQCVSVWLNSSDLLPPVSCPLLIEVGEALVPAVRTGFIAKKSDDMEYRLSNGRLIHGRYRWTYP